MKRSESQKALNFPTIYIEPNLWADTIRPSDDLDLRLHKIAALRSSIASGTYRVSASDLAEKLINHMHNNA